MPRIRMDCHPSGLIGAPISAIPTIFMPDALPLHNPPNLFWLETGTEYAGLHTQWLGYVYDIIVLYCFAGTLYIRRRSQLLREKSAEGVILPGIM